MAVVFIFINGIVLLNVCQCVGLLLEGGTVEHIQLQQLKSDIDRIGSTYVRWGRHDCPAMNGTSLVYSGIAAGALFSTVGGGVNYLCLPHNPGSFLPANEIHPQQSYHQGSIYGAEYQFNYGNVHLDDDVPCAVCYVPAAVLMIPAKNSCPTSWLLQYSGILTTNSDDYKSSSEFVCLDDNPQYLEGTRRNNDDGKLFYPVHAICGSLPCPPYVNNTYLRCCVCSK